MNGWTAICIVILAVSVDAPGAAALAGLVWLLSTSPDDAIARLERRVRRLEGK